MALATGATLGPYAVAAKVGEGGMGGGRAIHGQFGVASGLQ